MANNLLSCPFCGPGTFVELVEIWEAAGPMGWRVACGACGSSSGHCMTALEKDYGMDAKAMAVKSWNTRDGKLVTPLDPPLLGRLDEWAGDEAVCYVRGHFEMPRVGFPSALFRKAGFAVGDWFLWDEFNLVKVPDPDRLAAEENAAELDQLLV